MACLVAVLTARHAMGTYHKTSKAHNDRLKDRLRHTTTGQSTQRHAYHACTGQEHETKRDGHGPHRVLDDLSEQDVLRMSTMECSCGL